MNTFARGPDYEPDTDVDAPGPRLTGTRGASRVPNAEDRHRPQPDWYAYRVTGAVELPSWAEEVALTVERPPAPAAADRTSDPADERPAPLEPRGPPTLATGAAPRGRQAWVAGAAPTCPPGSAVPQDPARMRAWVPSAALPGWDGRVSALLLLRARGRSSWLDAIAEAVAEVESLAGVGPDPGGVEPVPGVRGSRRLRLLVGPAWPGLEPVAPAVAWSYLRAAGSRGLPAPMRRRRPAAGGPEPSWRASAGSVFTCDGPDGTSAQAVVALYGLGGVAAIAPPPGGALVLRAWKARRGWGMACGLVIGAATALGLGREAGRAGARARVEGWRASVLSGPVAMQLARAGRPDLPAPEAAAREARDAQVAAMLAACLAAAAVIHEASGDLPASW